MKGVLPPTHLSADLPPCSLASPRSPTLGDAVAARLLDHSMAVAGMGLAAQDPSKDPHPCQFLVPLPVRQSLSPGRRLSFAQTLLCIRWIYAEQGTSHSFECSRRSGIANAHEESCSLPPILAWRLWARLQLRPCLPQMRTPSPS